jgi:hypothetical protein
MDYPIEYVQNDKTSGDFSNEDKAYRPKDRKSLNSLSKADKKLDKEFRKNRQNGRGRNWQGEE